MNTLQFTKSILDNTRGNKKLLWVAITIVVLSAGMYFNWQWLISIGLASTLLAVAPCLIMCALGVCMKHVKDLPDEKGNSHTPSSIDKGNKN